MTNTILTLSDYMQYPKVQGRFLIGMDIASSRHKNSKHLISRYKIVSSYYFLRLLNSVQEIALILYYEYQFLFHFIFKDGWIGF